MPIDQVPLPAPVGGINAVSAATEMPPTDALSLVNLIGGRLGVTTRLGYKEHATGLGGEVRTVIPFTGGTAAQDRLFAVTPSGIYDVTSATPVSKVTFGTAHDSNGWGTYTTFVTLGGHYILYADEARGLYRYTQSTDTWAAVTDIQAAAGQSGTISGSEVAFVTTWKNRLWFVKRDSGDSWFLDVGAIAGDAKHQGFGSKFRGGGYLVGLWSWTRDGGSGMDDMLVAVSSVGDVLVYQGSDPSTPTDFEIKGSFSVGGIPVGRRIATDFGGELLLLTALGIMPVSKLLLGLVGQDQYVTQKIQPLFNTHMAEHGNLWGWSVRIHPRDNALVVSMPLRGSRREQYAMSLATQGWTLLSGVPSLSSDVWRGEVYFGTPDGRVCLSAGGKDIDQPVEWWGQTGFQPSDGRRSRVHTIQPLLRMSDTTSHPGVEVQARFDFHTNTVSAVPPAPSATADAPVWGIARWGQARWPGGEGVFSPWRGASGSGHYASVAFRGRSNTKTTLLGFNVRFDKGGIL